ncbi:hypothetical protein BHM03_00047693 [Ensete ventricosum]|nr:hypothetical protein BHM03_00047693 [Ensete ventricosum]
MARQETDDQTRKKRQEQQSKESSTTSSSPLPPHPRQLTPPHFLQHLHVDPELSRKRSLQRFLQKRNSRTNAVSPYRHPPQLFFSIKSTARFRPCAQPRPRWSGIGWEARERSTGPARERASAGSARECTSGSSISGSTEGSKISSGWGQPIWPL